MTRKPQVKSHSSHVLMANWSIATKYIYKHVSSSLADARHTARLSLNVCIFTTMLLSGHDGSVAQEEMSTSLLIFHRQVAQPAS